MPFARAVTKTNTEIRIAAEASAGGHRGTREFHDPIGWFCSLIGVELYA